MEDLNILAIDNSATMRRIIVSTLRRAGYTSVLEAAGGAEAIATLEQGSVDFIIANLDMPDMDGLEFVARVRQTDGHSSVPILMVTARSVKDQIKEAINAGVSNYIVRPFTPDTLKDKITQTLEGISQIGKRQRSGGMR
ncbi:MAG: response regulator [Candidatus Zixiibacteriota bacterium]